MLKSKIAGDIRIQAKEKVPAAVLSAATAMKPHFEKCVDDFARRLSEFVTGAGNTLYKGIGEILDRTLRERREQGDQLGALRASTATQALAVHAARAALIQLRESAWHGPEALPDAPEPTSAPA